jgi:hypothetical protein
LPVDFRELGLSRFDGIGHLSETRGSIPTP